MSAKINEEGYSLNQRVNGARTEETGEKNNYLQTSPPGLPMLTCYLHVTYMLLTCYLHVTYMVLTWCLHGSSSVALFLVWSLLFSTLNFSFV